MKNIIFRIFMILYLIPFLPFFAVLTFIQMLQEGGTGSFIKKGYHSFTKNKIAGKEYMDGRQMSLAAYIFLKILKVPMLERDFEKRKIQLKKLDYDRYKDI
jgi:hypothetical protein